MSSMTAVGAITTLIGFAVGYAVRWVLAHPDEVARLNLLIRVGGIVVTAVEQLAALRGWNADQKKKEAVQRFTSFLRSLGVQVSEDDVDTIIESAVKDMKDAGREIKAAAATTTASPSATITGSGGAGV